MHQVLTPQQQCLLQFFLGLPVDQVTSKIPSLRERCWNTLDTGLLLKAKRHIRDLTTEWKKHGPFGYSRLNVTKYLDVDGSVSICPLGIMSIDFDWGIQLNNSIHTAGEGVYSTIIQCVHEQSLTGICIFPVLFASNGSPMYKSLTKTKKYSELEAYETLKRVASANAII